MRRAGTIFAIILFLLAVTSAAFALSSSVREGSIEEAPGFRFENLRFGDDYITLDIVNMTDKNVDFSGRMIFLDIRNRSVAEVNLPPRWSVAKERIFYKINFSTGSGASAEKANKILWYTEVK